MSQEILLTDSNFEQNVIKSDKPILVDFWAPWCGPCRFVGPILTEIANEKADVLTVGKLNVDENRQVAESFQITGIPTMILFKGGQPVERIVGALPKTDIESALAKHLN
jgi:thioredoxin 1